MARHSIRDSFVVPVSPSVGAPLIYAVGGQVYVYDLGTTTPVSETLYAGRTGGTTLANPITLDATGRFTFWVDAPKRYTIKITYPGMTDITKDVDTSTDPDEIIRTTGTQTRAAGLTLQSPTINTPSITGGTLAGQTLTNPTLSGGGWTNGTLTTPAFVGPVTIPGVDSGGAGGLKVFDNTVAGAGGTVGIGEAAANPNHTFTVARGTTAAHNMLMLDWWDNGVGTDSGNAYVQATQGNPNAHPGTGFSTIRAGFFMARRPITTDTPGYNPLDINTPITSTGEGTRALELGIYSQVARSGAAYVDESVVIFGNAQANGQLTAPRRGTRCNAFAIMQGIDGVEYFLHWAGPSGYPGGVGYPNSVVNNGESNGGLGTGTRVSIQGDRTRPYFCVIEPGRLGVLTATPSYPIHLKDFTASEYSTFTYPVLSAPASMIGVEMESSATAPAHYRAAGLTDPNKRLVAGINTGGTPFGSIQAYSAASTATFLALNPAGGNVNVGATTASIAKLGVKQASDASGGGIGIQNIAGDAAAQMYIDPSDDFYFQLNSPGGARYLQFKDASSEIFTASKLSANLAVNTNTGFQFNGTQVVVGRQTGFSTIGGSASGTYTSTEQGLINTLISRVHDIRTILNTHGLTTTV